MKEKPNAGSPLFWAFPSDDIHRATKDVNVHFFIHSIKSYKVYQRIPGNYGSYYVDLSP